MTKPNDLEVTQQKLQKFHWPVWFPYPSSWLKASILALFLRVIIFVIKNTGQVGLRIAYLANSPELFVIFLVLATLSPILVITFTHHLVHLFLSRFLPEFQAPEIGKTQGFSPIIISYWEGLYGWLVIAISTLVAIMCTTIALPLFNLSYENPVELYTKFEQNVILIFGCTWISIGAFVYQIEFLFKRRLLSTHTVVSQENTSKNNLNTTIDVELDKLRSDMGLTQIKKGKSQLPEMIPISKRNQQNYLNLNKKSLLILLIPFVTVGIYIFSQLNPNIQKNIPLTVISQPQSESSALPQADNFREAVNQAVIAANLTQSAKSQTEWNKVVNAWQRAIELMKTVPASSSNYAVAQQKILEYQQNLSYAQKNAVVRK